MQILTVSDEIERAIYSPGLRQQFGSAELVLSCGDLPPYYLEYIVSMLNVPCVYVPGNHDGHMEERDDGPRIAQPHGWISADGRVVRCGGLSIAGLGGCIWYNGDAYQYTERQMLARVVLLFPRLLLRQRRDGHRLDIFIAHSPPAGVHDGPRAHRGFRSLLYLMQRIKPRYYIHGHVHQRYGYNRTVRSVVGTTTVINTVGHQVVHIEPQEVGHTPTARSQH